MTEREENFASKLERTLCDLDFDKGATVKIDEGYVWIRHRPNRPWRKANRIPPDLHEVAFETINEFMSRIPGDPDDHEDW